MAYLAARASQATCCSSIGAGDVDRAPGLLREALADDRGRGGRPARAAHDDRDRRARAMLRAARRRSTSSRSCSRWAARRGLAVETIGLGSNVLVARRRGRRARAAARRGAGRRARRGGRRWSRAAARRTPSACIARATPGSAASSSPRAIPGTAGGGVRMNAGAYGSDWRAVLVEPRWSSRGRRATVTADELGLAYRHSGLASGRGRGAGATSGSPRGRSRRSRPRSPSCSRGGRRRSRRTSARSAASSRTPTRAGAGRMHRGVRAQGPPDRRRADLAGGTRTSSRTRAARASADALALMVEARRRVHERFGVELEHEVRLLGPLELPPPVGKRRGAANRRAWRTRSEQPAHAAARPARAGAPRSRRIPLGRSLVGFGRRGVPSAPTRRAARPRSSPCASSRSSAARPRVARAGAGRARARAGPQPAADRRHALDARSRRCRMSRARTFRPCVPAHAAAASSSRSGRSCCSGRGAESWVVSARGRVIASLPSRTRRVAAAALAAEDARDRGGATLTPADGCAGRRGARADRRGAAIRGRVRTSRRGRPLADARSALGPRDPARRHRRPRLKLAIARRILRSGSPRQRLRPTSTSASPNGLSPAP